MIQEVNSLGLASQPLFTHFSYSITESSKRKGLEEIIK